VGGGKNREPTKRSEQKIDINKRDSEIEKFNRVSYLYKIWKGTEERACRGAKRINMK